MSTTKASELAVFVKERLGGDTSKRLVELTNDDSIQTTINTTVLLAACDDALSEFRIITGIEPDTSTPIYSHLSALTPGVLAYLEEYKGRSVGLAAMNRKNFYARCKSISDRKFLLAKSDSVLSQSSERQDARPDFDRSRSAFSGGWRVSSPRQYYDTEE